MENGDIFKNLWCDDGTRDQRGCGENLGLGSFVEVLLFDSNVFYTFQWILKSPSILECDSKAYFP